MPNTSVRLCGARSCQMVTSSSVTNERIVATRWPPLATNSRRLSVVSCGVVYSAGATIISYLARRSAGASTGTKSHSTLSSNNASYTLRTTSLYFRLPPNGKPASMRNQSSADSDSLETMMATLLRFFRWTRRSPTFGSAISWPNTPASR